MIYTKSKIYSAEAAAKELNISPMTMHRRIRAGIIYAQNIGSELRPKYAIHESELVAYSLFKAGEIEVGELISNTEIDSGEEIY